MKLIYVEWCDTVTENDGWKTEEEAKEWGKNAQWVVREVGFLIEENKEYLLMATRENEWDETEEKFGAKQYGMLTKIPKTWIRKRVDLTKHIK